MADVAEPVADEAGGDAAPHRLFADIEHALDGGIDLADAGGERRVAVPAVDDRAAIDRDDVALVQDVVVPAGCRARPRR